MKLTLSWLKDHLETTASLGDIVSALTELGLEVEGVTDPAARFANFRVAFIASAEKHPDADKLRVCAVETGAGTLQVVCGAPNARAGLKVCLALPGAVVPKNGMTIKEGKIRGVESKGMLCSADELCFEELGLSADAAGIVELPEDAPVGRPLAEQLGASDPVIEIAITPDRADCLGVRGVARDLAAKGLGTLKPLARTTPVAGSFDSPVRWARDFAEADADACPYVVGRTFRGLKNGPSPAWLQARLRAVGLRPISALVDVTNYVSYDLGRPLHVFDVDKLTLPADGALTMRLSRAAETLAALDGKTYTLDDRTVVIADASGPQAIGGVMGGEHSGCSETTTTCFLEVALFAPTRVAHAGRSLGILSDARYRFERWVDPASADYGTHVATHLILELCGGEVSRLTDAGTVPAFERTARLRFARIAALTGVEVAPERAVAVLESLGFVVLARDESAVTVRVPSFRSDIDWDAPDALHGKCVEVKGEVDLVEEVVRVVGYDQIPTLALSRSSVLPTSAVDLGQRRVLTARRLLAQRGLRECVTFSFTSRKLALALLDAGRAAQPEKALEPLTLANPIAAELDVMRPSVLAHLLAAVERNQARGVNELALFEVGPAYLGVEPGGQQTHASGLRVGQTGPRHFAERPRPVDVFDAKADALAVLAALGVATDKLQVSAGSAPYFHPGRAGELRFGPKVVVARFGELHPALVSELSLRGPVVAFEVVLDAIPAPKPKKNAQLPALELHALNPLSRDFAFVVGEEVTAASLLSAVRGAEKELLRDATVFDVFVGESVGAAKKSLAVTVTLQPKDKPLTDVDIEAVSKRIVEAAAKQVGAELRG